MKKLVYVSLCSILREYPDWRIQAMAELEPRICFLSSPSVFRIGDYTQEDLAQELRLQVWKKLPKFDPTRSKLLTWGQMVMTFRLIDLNRMSQRHNDQNNSQIKRTVEESLSVLDSMLLSVSFGYVPSYNVCDGTNKTTNTRSKRNRR